LNGQSSLRKVELETGRVLQRVDLATQYFAEGITLHEGKIYQLTWQSGKGFVYSLEGLQPIDEFSYKGEGWGLTDDGRYLIMSDGTNQLQFLNPTDFTVHRTLDVYSGDEPVTYLNELEYVKGEIYANIWYSDRVARIDPHTGQVVGWIELDDLLSPPYRRRPEAVLNGIAYDEAHDRLFVTGKLWPKIFEIRVPRKVRAALR
jgi:glutamine cyclotransferase